MTEWHSARSCVGVCRRYGVCVGVCVCVCAQSLLTQRVVWKWLNMQGACGHRANACQQSYAWWWSRDWSPWCTCSQLAEPASSALSSADTKSVAASSDGFVSGVVTAASEIVTQEIGFRGGVSARGATAVPADPAPSEIGIATNRFSTKSFNSSNPSACSVIFFEMLWSRGFNRCVICCAEALVASDIESSAWGARCEHRRRDCARIIRNRICLGCSVRSVPCCLSASIRIATFVTLSLAKSPGMFINLIPMLVQVCLTYISIGLPPQFCGSSQFKPATVETEVLAWTTLHTDTIIL